MFVRRAPLIAGLFGLGSRERLDRVGNDLVPTTESRRDFCDRSGSFGNIVTYAGKTVASSLLLSICSYLWISIKAAVSVFNYRYPDTETTSRDISHCP